MDSTMWGGVQSIEEEVANISRALAVTCGDSPSMVHLLDCLGRAYAKRFNILHQLDDNRQAIENWTIALALTPEDHPLMPNLLDNLSTAHGQRFQRLGNMDNINQAIEYACVAIAFIPEGHRDLPRQLGNLGAYHKERFQRLGELDELERAMEYDLHAIILAPEGHPHLPSMLTNIGACHSFRFERLGMLSDLEEAIRYRSRAVDLTPNGHPHLPSILANLGTSHLNRFERLGELADLEKAIQHHSRALNLTPDDHPDLSGRLANLGSCHNYRFKRLGEFSDLEKAIQYQSLALNLTPSGHPSFSSVLLGLGITHSYRFEHRGELDDAEKAIQYFSRAVDATPDGHPGLSSVLANLGTSHGYRFKRLGELSDLEKAILYDSRALDLTPEGHPGLSSVLANLGASHSYRFKRLGEVSDLEKAIQYSSRAVDLTPNGHPDLSSVLANLGTCHTYRFERLGKLSDLEKAIQHHFRALDLTPDGHPNISSGLANLGTSHLNRFERLGELADLEKAIQYQSRALNLTPDGHPLKSSWLANLGTSHSRRFRHLDEVSDLEKAIQYRSRAVDLTPEGHPYLPIYLADLGTSHGDRFKRLRELSDLEKAILYDSRALDLTPNDHSDYSHRISSLGITYKNRFCHLGELGDLEKAIQCQSRAVASAPDGHPHSAMTYFHSATSSLLYYLHSKDSSHLDNSLKSFRMATQSTTTAPRYRFQFASQWATLASEHSAFNPIEAYQAAIDILPQFIWLGATTNQRYEYLSTSKALAVDAAFAAILALDYSLALEWLEHARCVVWTQNTMLRSPLDQLESSHPNLAVRLQTVAAQLHSASSDTRESRTLASGSRNAEQVAQEHRRLAQVYDELIAETRTLAGFEDFLCPIKAMNLFRAARLGPIVVINCHKARCDALVIRPGQNHVDHIPLPEFTADKALRTRIGMESAVRGEQVGEHGAERRPVVETGYKSDLRSILGILWQDIIKPILNFLGYTNDVSVGSLPHITWCPTGAVSFLPLHAAGDYDQPRSRVFDYVISSYTPTLTALLESTPSALRPNPRVLAIGQAATPGHSPLPGTTQEIMHLKAHTENKFEYSQLIDGEATKSAVLDAMEHHDWVHLACHAHQNVMDPTKSGFFLHDDVLDLASINRQSFKNKGLAFLSACQTATGHEKLPDEAVHLASGMLMAGYTSVIATMWSVVDADAPVVANRVYAELMKDGKVGSGEAGRALHNAVAVLRKEVGEEAFERWVCYIHIGS